MFVTRRLHGAKPQVKGAQGSASRPDFELVQAEIWQLCSHVGFEEDPMPERRWKSGGVASRPRGWPPDRPSPPNQLN
jgi:hypothetical protein